VKRQKIQNLELFEKSKKLICAAGHGASFRAVNTFTQISKFQRARRETKNLAIASRVARVREQHRSSESNSVIRDSSQISMALAKLSEHPYPLFAAIYIAIYRHGGSYPSRSASKFELGSSELSIAHRASARTALHRRERESTRARVYSASRTRMRTYTRVCTPGQPVGEPSVATNFEFISLRRYKRHKSLL